MGLLYSKLSSLYDSFTDHSMRILMLGLDAAGKTTTLYRLKLNEPITTIPTIGFNVETITPQKGVSFTVWDVGGGGHAIQRRLWRHYYQNTQGLLYVIDSCDRERFDDAYDAFREVIESEDMTGVPVVILANKQDLPNPASCSEIADALHLHKLTQRKVHVQPTSGTTGEGLYEAIEKLTVLTKEFQKERENNT